MPKAEIPAHDHLAGLRHGCRLDPVSSALFTYSVPPRLCHPQQFPRHTIPAGLGLFQKHGHTVPWPGQCSGCDGDGGGSQSFKDRDGDTEKDKWKEGERQRGQDKD